MALVLSGDTGPSFVQAAAMPSGSVVQVLQTVKTDTYVTTSSSWGAVTGLSQAITPTSATSKILVTIMVNTGSPAGLNAGGAFRLYRDGVLVTGATGDTAGNRTTGWGQSAAPTSSGWYIKEDTLVYLDSPATTSSVTYQLYARAENVGGTSINYAAGDDSNISDRTRTVSTITVMEIKQ